MELSKIRAEILSKDGTSFPAKTFADAVLRPVFETQRDHYHHAFIRISMAHAVMLRDCGIVTEDEASRILGGLMAVREMDFSDVEYDPQYEDMFFMLERDLFDRIGADAGGRLHIARSRNDICIGQFRMALRGKLLSLAGDVLSLMELMLALAQEHMETIMPAYTHTQPAQPTTLSHYLLAFHDVLSRNLARIERAYENTNRSPMGAAAITTTGFAINREQVCNLLGFEGLVENAYDAIAGADYLSETAGCLMALGVDLSRFLKDTLDFCTSEFAVFRLADPYVQVSSIMPQKRNPSSLEHARPITSAAIGEAQAVITMLHNTPFGDMVDSEEQLQPHLYASIKNAQRALSLLRSNYATMEVNRDCLKRRAHENFITATELADALVRERGLPFRESHRLTAKIVRGMHSRGLVQADLTEEILRECLAGEMDIDFDLVRRALDPEHFVRIRGIVGGPAKEEATRMLTAREATLREGQTRIAARHGALKRAEDALEAAVRKV